MLWVLAVIRCNCCDSLQQLLDVVMAGPKMRKWYGQASSNLPKDGGGPPEQVRPGMHTPVIVFSAAFTGRMMDRPGVG